MKRLRWNSGNRSRRGLSLLELVVAMAIGSVLLSAIWTMFNVIALRQERETLKAEETQLVRSLHQILARDLSRVVPQSANAPSGSQSPAMPLPLFGPNSMAAPAGFVWSPGPRASLSGTADRLELICFSGPSAPLAPKPLSDQKAGDPDTDHLMPSPAARSIVYQWAGTGRPRSARLSTPGDRAESENDSAQRPGLTRIESAVAGRNSGREPGTAETVCEFHRVMLQYFDGKSWQSSWDSTVSGQLPVAIRVQFGLKMQYVPEDRIDPDKDEPAREADAFDEELADSAMAESDTDVHWRSFVLLVTPLPASESGAQSRLDPP